ncbi:hypothetical protein, partial [Phocaeicola sp.]|uniref:hypothetical protein n=1 Tax=Phocaeicola sp. TaxID=2773926 RepID=UPI003AB1ADC9
EYTVRNNTYRVVPITFQSYNAKGFGEYEKGFEPDILMDETNPYNEHILKKKTTFEENIQNIIL